MNAISNFCEERKIIRAVRDAFVTYCHSMYATKFGVSSSGDTIKTIISKLTKDQVEDAWGNFVIDLKQSIS